MGRSESYARTVAATAFVMGEVFYLLNCRSLERSALAVGLFSNLWVWGGIATMLLAQAGFVVLPAMQRLFDTTAIDIGSWAGIVASGVLIFAIVGLEKALRRRAAKPSGGIDRAASAGVSGAR